MATRLLLVLLAVWLAASTALAVDDTLPNFNAPTDNTPLDVAKVNRYLNVPLFDKASLWDEDADAVAQRLAWPQESSTSTQSSFRLYPTDKNPVTILGARAYSCVLYAGKGHPNEVSIVFVNQGDYEWREKYAERAHEINPQDAQTPDAAASTTNNAHASSDPFSGLHIRQDDISRVDRDVHDAFEKALKQDTQTITDNLTKLFGEPIHMSFGGGSETRERVLRWDWQGHAFLLANPKDIYVALRIVPVAFADNYGKGEQIDRDQLKTDLLSRVKKSDNGDVFVSEIPMVDQGPKGFCVPATWERYMRYLGIPTDMYVLALAAGTTPQGTNLDAMIENVDSLVTLYHRRIDASDGDLDMRTIAKSIDRGLPIMWTCTIHVPFERAVSKRKIERAAITDWDAWTTELQNRDKDLIPKEIDGSPIAGGHQRMIIGYNPKTNEIAETDSWSRFFEIRWMTLNEANKINAGHNYVIEP